MMAKDTPCFCMKGTDMVNKAMQGKMGLDANDETGYMNVCGKCMDPCSLRFIPDHMGGHDSSEEDMMNMDMDDEDHSSEEHSGEMIGERRL